MRRVGSRDSHSAIRLVKTTDLTKPVLLLRVEGAAVLVVALLLYRELGQSWLLFVLLFLLPDLSLLGYLRGKLLGAITYNVVHTYLLPAVLFALGFLLERGPAMGIALIWGAHIGIDRLIGFGLKYSTGRRDTHMQRVM